MVSPSNIYEWFSCRIFPWTNPLVQFFGLYRVTILTQSAKPSQPTIICGNYDVTQHQGTPFHTIGFPEMNDHYIAYA